MIWKDKITVSVGDRYGKLTVVEVGLKRELKKKPGHFETVCRCTCDCGGEKLVPPCHLMKGLVTSCGCKKKSPLKVGDTSGELTVIKVGITKGPKGNRQQYCVCRCSCGAEKEFLSTSIVQKKVKTCDGPSHSYKILGDIHGHLEVVDADVGIDGKGYRLIRCKCHNCGGETIMKADEWSKKRRTDCGCESIRKLRVKYNVNEGDTFGNLTVLRTRVEQRGTIKVGIATCRCSCGDVRDYTIHNLCIGKVKSCGCYGRVANGEVFGRLTVIDNSLTDSKGCSCARCVCSCEKHTELVVVQNALKRGNTRSCGCLMSKHGDSQTRLYGIWIGMLDRVHHTNRRYSKWYIEKGIKVCPEWEEWLNFKAWSLANGYDDSLTLDRINSDGNYCPENCRWATRKEQNNNKSDNVVIEFEGVKKTATQWGESIGATGAVVKRRLDHGWTIEEAVKTPNGTTRGWRERIQK